MRPIKLVLENVGPYRERAEIDFSRLGPVFLVWGKTGSGKTTIFDAMTYALYGKVSGSRESLEGQLWSHYAKPGDKALVEFEFALGEELYRTTRRPPGRRIGRDGEEKDTPPEASLWLAEGGEWRLLNDKKSEVDEAVRRKVGLSVEEFSKIVLLPQGQFQRFLEMNSTDRSAILEKLFPVDLHEAVAAIAREKAKAVAEEGRRLDLEIERLRSEAGAAAEGIAEGEAARNRLEEALREAASARDAARGLSTKARVAYDRGLDAERLRTALKAAEARAEALEARRPEIEALRRALDAASRAAPVLPVIDAAAAAGKALGEERRSLEARRSELAALEARAAEVEGRRVETASAVAELGRLDHELGLLAAAAEAWAKAAACGKAEAEARTATDVACAGFESAKEAESKAEAAAQAAFLDPEEEARLAADLETAGQAFEKAKRVAEQAGELERWSRREVAAKEAVSKAGHGLEAAEASLYGLEAEGARDMAARLAASLLPGEPCPVCGSREHPEPAHGRPALAASSLPAGDEGSVTKDALERAREERDRRLAEKAGAEADYAGAIEARRGAEDALLAQCGGGGARLPTVEEAKAARQEAETRASRAAALVRGLGQRRLARDAAALSLDKARRAREAAQARFAEARDLAGRRAAELEAVLAHSGGVDPSPRIAALKGERAAVEARRAESARQVEAWERSRSQAVALAAESEGRLPALETQAAAAAEALSAALRDGGFADAAAARAAALPREERSRSETAVAAWDRGLAEARSQADSTRLALGEAAPVDLAALEAERVRTAALEEEAQSAFDAARDALAAWDRLALSLSRALDARRELSERASRLSLLAALLCGDLPPRRLPFKNYVLGLYFREVVERASIRLDEMSEGRYGLLPDSGESGGRGRLGLEISVRDSHTGRKRPAGTLSGGERFLTSLALSLGLADTIRSRAGGVALDAVFIDEGFGSLDEEALDRAVDVLDRARGARMIGIVSHVAELRSRISSRIEVGKGKGGSRLTVV